MIYKDFQGLKLAALGMGAMRLPVIDGDDARPDQPAVQEMVDYAMANGVNYYDTAWGYHAGNSELAMGQALAKYPRESFYLADKVPGYDLSNMPKVQEIFEEQLKKCGVEYFDFYLLHNVYENSIGTYTDPKWGILDYFKEQVKNGRIKHLGFSSHARPDTLEKFLDYAGEDMEFCQIQLNYLDWTLQDAKAKYELLTEHNIPVWVMEPVRGGRLAALSDEDTSKLKTLRPEDSVAAWAFRWLQNLPNVKMVLSGMSSMAQMEDNVKTFSSGAPQTKQEAALLMELADSMKNALPCTRCRYCCDGCPQGLDIPMLIHAYNDVKFSGGGMTVAMQFDALPDDKRPAACIKCGACAAICPQNIGIPGALEELTDILAKTPSWAEMCRQREEAARKLKEQK